MAPKTKQLRPVMTRIPEDLRKKLGRVAAQNGRSMNAEIIHRLEQSFVVGEKEFRQSQEIIFSLLREGGALAEKFRQAQGRLEHSLREMEARYEETEEGRERRKAREARLAEYAEREKAEDSSPEAKDATMKEFYEKKLRQIEERRKKP